MYMRTFLVGLLILGTVLPININGFMHASERSSLREKAREMFYHGYNSYMDYAFPWDELKPISCQGRRWDRRERGDLDDTLGGFSLTLIDSLDMLAVLGDRDEFLRAVRLVIDTVHFDRDVTVSVFESTIRVIGGLISAHLIASPEYLGVLSRDEYDGELLSLAVDLGRRLLPAFDTPTNIPFHRINLKRGILATTPSITCPAAAGSLLLEMAYLSRLSGDQIFEQKALLAVVALWRRRSELNLLGSSINVISGEWQTSHVGIGAGLDSFFEYLLKYHLVSGNSHWLEMFNTSYRAVEDHTNHHDFHIEVDMNYGRQVIRSRRVSALQAFWPGLQVLAGEVSNAMRTHERLFSLWNKFGAMPELFELSGRADSIRGDVISWARTSPLRPELIESTYHLYQATRDHKYLKIGRKLLEDIERVSRVDCGYAAVGNIHTLTVEDRMDSYFLSETVKYLYLLFSDDTDVIVPSMPQPEKVDKMEESQGDFKQCVGPKPNKNAAINFTRPAMWSRALKSSQVVFSTEGHVFVVDSTLFERPAPHISRSHECQNGIALIKAEWSAGSSVSDFVPVGVAVRLRNGPHVKTLVASPASFGRRLGRFASTEGSLLLYTRLVGDACKKVKDQELLAQIRGRVVMVTRGVCSFAEKALILQHSGAIGVIIINNKDGHRKPKRRKVRRYMMADDRRGNGRRVHIPVVMISRDDASTLIHHIKKLQEAQRRRSRTMFASEESGLNNQNTIDEPNVESEEEMIVTLSPWLH